VIRHQRVDGEPGLAHEFVHASMAQVGPPEANPHMQISFAAGRALRDGAPVPYRHTPNRSGGKLVPKFIVLHETAGRLRKGSSIDWLCNPKAKASAHFVVERDGAIVQLADLDARTWHAGRSSWRGFAGLNDYSVGIEVVGPGKLKRAGEGAKAWFGQDYDRIEWGLEEVAGSPTHGTGLWMPWTPEQHESVTELCRAICAEIPAIDEIVGHYQISPGRKVDPSPLIDISAIETATLIKPAADEMADGKLAIGDSGPKVRLAQERLKELGYKPGYVDGIAGPVFRDAVLSFLARNDLEVKPHLSRKAYEHLMSIQAIAWAQSDARQNASKADVAKVDDKMDTARKAKTVAGGVGTAVVVGEVLEKVTTTSTTATSATRSVDALWTTFVTHWQIVVILGGCIALWIWWEKIERLILRDHREGRDV